MTEDNDLFSYFLLLQFGFKKSSLQAAPILNNVSIAKAVKDCEKTKRLLISFLGLQALKENNVIQLRLKFKFKDRPIQYLISHRILREWGPLSII